MHDFELTLLERNQILGYRFLPVFKPYGVMAATTDFAILTGNKISEDHFCRDDKPHLTGRSGAYWLKPSDSLQEVFQKANCIDALGYGDNFHYDSIKCGIRPVLVSSNEFIEQLNKRIGYAKVPFVTFGEYPQYVEQDPEKIKLLNKLYSEDKLKFTGKAYTVDGYYFWDGVTLLPSIYMMEYELNKEKYITTSLIKSDSLDVQLSNGEFLQRDIPYWIKVEPITWLYDETSNLLISKRILLSGIPLFFGNAVKGFDTSFIKNFMNTFMAKEIISPIPEQETAFVDENQAVHNYVYWKKPKGRRKIDE